VPRPRRAAEAGDAPAPGATPRGAKRRQQLVDAATAILEASGFEAISHRAVAARANLPLAATTYYFATLDDLRSAALSQLSRAYVDYARELAVSLPASSRTLDEISRLLVALVAGDGVETDPAWLLTFYERYVQAGRHPALRQMVRGWTAELAQLASIVLERSGYPPDRELARLLIGAIDGLLLDALIDGNRTAPSIAAAGVAGLLQRLQCKPPVA
jgi:DNA-binding transcriptional regulator YbjK